MDLSLRTVQILGGMLAGVMAMARWLPPVLQSTYKPNENNAGWSTQTLADPKVGSVAKDLDLLPLLRSKPSLVLVVSDCSQCNAAKISRFADLKLRQDISRLVVVASESPQEELLRIGRSKGVSIVGAPRGLEKDWNITFFPRVYAVSKQGKFLYLESPAESFELGFSLAVKELYR